MALRAKNTAIVIWRTAVQMLFVALTAFVAVRHQFTKGPDGTPPLDAYCPMGGVVAIYEYVTTGAFIRELSPNNFVMLAMLVAMVIITKSAFCGWVCPFGTVQDWVARIGRTVTPKAVQLPPNIDAPARYVKYAVLVVIVVLTATTGQLVFKNWDPFIAMLHLGTGHLASSAYVVLAVVLVASLFVERPWCKYLCPLAPIVGLLGKLSLVKIERNEAVCKDCGLCNTACPMGIDVCHSTRITSAECNGCLDCMAHDPLPDSLYLCAGPRGRRLGWAVFPITVLAVFFASLGIGRATGHWSERKLPHQRGNKQPHIEQTAPHQAVPPLPESVEPLGQAEPNADQVEPGSEASESYQRGQRDGRNRTPEGDVRGDDRDVQLPDGRRVEVRGYMTFSEIARRADVPTGDLLAELGMEGRTQPGDHVGRAMRAEGQSMNAIREAVRRLIERKGKEE